MAGFWIDVYDSAGVKEDGTSINVSDVQLSEKANRIGQVSFRLPAAETTVIGALYGKRYKLFSARNGYIGKFRHQSMEVDADGRTATITANDSLIDLADQIVGFNRSYNASVKAIVEAIATIANPDWTVAYEPGTATFFQSQPVALEFQGESVLTAFDFVRNYVRGWFRRSGDTQITFGRFRDLGFQNTYYNQSTRVGADGTVAIVPTIYADANWLFKYNGNQARVLDSEIDAFLTNLPIASNAIQRSTQYTQNDETLAGTPAHMAIITGLTQEVDGTSIVNRVIPRGSGQGITVMDLRYSTFDLPFPRVYDAAGQFWYIEDVQSQALYGTVTRVLPFTEVRPITNSAGDLRAAGDALYALGLAYLRKFRAPFQVYRVQCVDLPEAAEIGSVVLIDFRGVATLPSGDTAWLTLDRIPFFIIEKTTRWLESGEAVYELVVSSNGEGNISTTDIFKIAMEEIRKFQARPEPTITYYHNANPTLPVQAATASKPEFSVDFPFALDAGVLVINNMTLEMQLSRFTAFGISELAADAFTVGLPPANQNTTETQDTSIGTAQGLRTQADQSSPQGSTSQSGGGSSPTTLDASPFHSHSIGIIHDSSGSPVYLQSGEFHSTDFSSPSTSGVSVTHSHLVNIPSHQHSFELPQHTHGMVHTHPLPGHTHKHDHVHGLDQGILHPTFGVFEADTLPENVSVYISGPKITTAIVTNWTVVKDLGNADVGGAGNYLCSGVGLFRADLTNYFPPPGQDHEGEYQLTIHCGTNGGLVFCRLLGRITVQPIAV